MGANTILKHKRLSQDMWLAEIQNRAHEIVFLLVRNDFSKATKKLEKEARFPDISTRMAMLVYAINEIRAMADKESSFS